MKTNVTTIAIAVLSISSLFTACKKEEIRPLQNNVSDKSEIQQPAERAMADYQLKPEDMLIAGKWAIPKYDGGNTEFKDYIFSFNQYHVVFAKGPERSFTGKWNMITVNGEKKLIIDFGMKNLIHLNNTWRLLNYSAKYFSFDGNLNGHKSDLTLISAENMPK